MEVREWAKGYLFDEYVTTTQRMIEDMVRELVPAKEKLSITKLKTYLREKRKIGAIKEVKKDLWRVLDAGLL